MSVHLAQTVARAWAVARRDGVVLGFTDHDRALAFDGIGFRPDTGLSAGAIMQGAGLSVDNSEAVGALSDDAITEADLMAGRWDGAEVRLWDVDWTDTANRALVFRGHLGEVSRGGAAFRAELRGLSESLGAAQGRVYHPRCSADLGDGQCGMDLSLPGYRAEGVIEAEEGGLRLRLAGIDAQEPHWFERGRLQVLSGHAQGLHGVVKNDQPLPGGARAVELWAALGIRPAPGDRVRLSVGCDKSAASCRLKFANFLNFRGFPHLPAEDWLMTPSNRGRQG